MTASSTYPIEISNELKKQWEKRGLSVSILPDPGPLKSLIDTMYQASLLVEEGDPVRCRIISATPDELASATSDEPRGLRVLPFAEPSSYTPYNLRKLSAAAGFYRSLLAVNFDESGELVIWGIVLTGTDWVNHVDGYQSKGVELPQNVVIQSLGPGHLIVASGFSRILETRNGQLLTEGFDPFLSEWLPRRFIRFRESLLRQLPVEQPNAQATQVCESFVRDVGQSVIRRILRLVRNRRHGGTLIFMPDGSHIDGTCERWLRFRVQYQADRPSSFYSDVMLRLMTRALHVGRTHELEVVTWSAYQKLHDPELAQLDEALIEFSHFVADMMSVDGAVVLDHSFRLLGFGGEILGETPVHKIDRALDLEAKISTIERADAAGTRHRSAYRLVNGLHDSLAIVASQDGDVRFVAHHNDQLCYWPYLP
ncbi:putative sensor domain DACNV-containing protein [Thalassoglobus sp. JC818]|uniref:putative sensor domain DACNV-containing protein n=1 Tax=Thalassoglobus sp. JC818 TaxID=3232136 RepID=UPI00345946A6